jgi:hypothetical protein
MVFVPRKSSHRFPQGSRRMFRNELILSVDSPRSVEKLPSFHLDLRIGSSLRAWGNIENQSSQPSRIIVADRSRIAKADDSIQVQMLRDFSPGFLGFSGPDGKATVEVF